MTQRTSQSQDTVPVTIDGQTYDVPRLYSVLQAALQHGIEIPRFCYHEQLSIAANCRMCLVETCHNGASSGTLVASCAQPVSANMTILTQSEKVKKARRGVMEFLLINHPLDCPICDQGGECDLQDQALSYGRAFSRYAEEKRAVAPQAMGPLITTHMTRCIHCTRCVRFASEIAGVDEIGMLNRGEKTFITTLNRAIDTELSGNLVDVCPVGALNARAYSGNARAWELRSVQSVDAHDAVGSSILIHSSGNAVMRILPRQNAQINEDWLADKGRFSFDGLKQNRLDTPFYRKQTLQPCSWEDGLTKAADLLTQAKPESIGFLSGDMCTVEEVYALKLLSEQLATPHRDCRQFAERLPVSPSALWRTNTPLVNIPQADVILMVGVNPKREAPLLNWRIRQAFLNGAQIAHLGHKADLNYDATFLGNDPEILQDLATNDHPWSKKLNKAKFPLVLLGTEAVCRGDCSGILSLIHRICTNCGADGTKWLGYNFVHRVAARCGGFMLDFLPKEGGFDTHSMLHAASEGQLRCLYLLGCHEIQPDLLARASKHGCSIIVQSHHGDAISEHADVILPGSAYTEKFGLMVNTEGRPQWTQQAVFPPGQAKEDWRIIRALAEVCGKKLNFDTHEELLKELFRDHPELEEINQPHCGEWAPFGEESRLMKLPFANPMPDYAATDQICRASKIMQSSSQTFRDHD